MRHLQRAALLVSALSVACLTGGCFYSHTVDRTPPAVVTTTTPDASSSTTTTTSNNGQVERQTTTTYSNP